MSLLSATSNSHSLMVSNVSAFLRCKYWLRVISKHTALLNLDESLMHKELMLCTTSRIRSLMSSRVVALFDLKHWFLNGIECCCVAQIQTIVFLMLSSVTAIYNLKQSFFNGIKCFCISLMQLLVKGDFNPYCFAQPRWIDPDA